MSQGRLLGGNIGLAIATIVLNQQLVTDLSSIVPADELNNLRHSLLALSLLTPEQAEVVQGSFARAFQIQLDINMGVAGAALLFAVCTWERRPTTFAQLLERNNNDGFTSLANLNAASDPEGAGRV